MSSTSDLPPPPRPLPCLEQSLLAQSRDGILLIDISSWVVTHANEQAARLFSRPASDLCGTRVEELIEFRDQDSDEALTRLLGGLTRKTGGAAEQGDSLIGSLRSTSLPADSIEFRATLFESEERAQALVQLHDLRERQLAEAERIALESRLRRGRRFEDVGVLAAGFAHDLSNFLTGILGNTEFALNAAGSLPEVTHFLERTLLGTRRAAQLSQFMLDLLGDHLREEALRIPELIEEVARLIPASLPHGIKLEVDLAGSIPAVLGNRAGLCSALINLVTNGAEAMGETPGRILVRAELKHFSAEYLQRVHVRSDLEEGEYVCLEVRDDGSGMDPDTIERAFDPFFTSKFDGRGLGLASVLLIVQLHGGTIKVASEPGRGSTIRILLPPCLKQPTPRPSTQRVQRANDHGGRVLLVEDDDLVGSLIQRGLKQAGFEVMLVGLGETAWSTLREQRRDLTALVLDVRLPDIDGLVVVERLRRIDARLPIVLISGAAEERVERLCAADEACCYLHKPFGPAALIDCLRQVVDRARMMG